MARVKVTDDEIEVSYYERGSREAIDADHPYVRYDRETGAVTIHEIGDTTATELAGIDDESTVDTIIAALTTLADECRSYAEREAAAALATRP